jgi:hypothetical protein
MKPGTMLPLKLGPWGQSFENEKTGRVSYRLTPEGEAEFERWRRDDVNPVYMLQKAQPNVYRASLIRSGRDHEMLEQCGWVGLWKALLTWREDLGSLSTHVVWKVRGELNMLYLNGYENRCRVDPRLGKVVHPKFNSRSGDFDAAGRHRGPCDSWEDVSRQVNARLGRDSVVSEEAERRDTSRLVRSAMSRWLTPRQEEAVRLRYGIGDDAHRTWPEVSRAMGISETAAENLVGRAQRTLFFYPFPAF